MENTVEARGPEKKTKERDSGYYCEGLSFAAKEAYNRLRTNILIALPEEEGKCRVVGITSTQPGEGKSLTAVNLAYSVSELGKRVLLLDGDMRKPTVHEKLSLELVPGLSNLLTDIDAVGKVIQKYSNSTGKNKFDVITGGTISRTPGELFNSRRMTRLMQALYSVYDVIIIDLPPVGAVVDAVSISEHVDGMIVVVKEQTCPRDLLEDCVEQLKFAGINILGFVVNGTLEGAGKKYGRSGYYGKSGYGSYAYE